MRDSSRTSKRGSLNSDELDPIVFLAKRWLQHTRMLLRITRTTAVYIQVTIYGQRPYFFMKALRRGLNRYIGWKSQPLSVKPQEVQFRKMPNIVSSATPVGGQKHPYWRISICSCTFFSVPALANVCSSLLRGSNGYAKDTQKTKQSWKTRDGVNSRWWGSEPSKLAPGRRYFSTAVPRWWTI